MTVAVRAPTIFDAVVPAQIVGCRRRRVPGEIVRRGNGAESKLPTDRKGDHILWNTVTRMDAGVETLSDDVPAFPLHGNIQADLRVFRREARFHRTNHGNCRDRM